jgi:glycosyltransferase involved in cell wall biosynthesis
MNNILTVCIPTLDRPIYLLRALKSILEFEKFNNFINICISDNASTLEYKEVEEYIKTKTSWRITYIKQKVRLSIDENMFYVVNMAQSEYVFLLGDDDLFISKDLQSLQHFVLDAKPDLAIFNSKVIDENGKYVKNHFKLKPQEYKTLESAFLDLRDKGTYGSILVKTKHLNEQYFKALFGTAHAYGCYWLSILNSERDNVKIFIPDFQCTFLTAGQKHYNYLTVYYRDILFEIAVYKRYVTTDKGHLLSNLFERKYNKMIISVSFLTKLLQNNIDIDTIKSINPMIYNSLSFRLNYLLSLGIVNLKLYALIKKIYNVLNRK